MKKWNSYLVGVLILILFLEVINIIIGPRVLDVTDIYIPFYNSSQYSESFFDLWKISGSGGIGNAPLSSLIGAVLSLIGITYEVMQFIIFSILVFFTFTSLYILTSYLSDGKNVMSLVLAFLFLLIEFRWAGFVGATGLNYFLGFAPLIIYFSIRMVRSEISAFRAIIFIALSFIGASFEITEAVPYSLFIYLPLLIMTFIECIILKHNNIGIKNFIRTQITFLSGILLGIVVLIYVYYPWILGALGIGNSSVTVLRTAFSSTNIFKANSFSSLIIGPSVFGRVLGFSGFSAVISGLIFIVLMLPYIIKRRFNLLLLSSYIFIVLVAFYIQIAISFPDLLFRVITSIPVLSSLLITLNEPAEMFYVVAVWEYVIIEIAVFDLLKNYHSIYGALSKHLSYMSGRSFTTVKNRRRIRAILAVAVVALLLLMSYGTVSSIHKISTGNDGYTPYGDYKIPNYIPNYVHRIYNAAANNSNKGMDRILLLPDYPRVERWEQTSQYFYTFPPSNSFQMSLFTSFISDIQAGNENGTGPLLNQMDIGYIAVIKALNQTETVPTIGYDNFNQPYAIFGNPSIFYTYFNSSPQYKLIENNGNYSLFKNIDSTGLFQDFRATALITNSSVRYTTGNSSVMKSPPSNSTGGDFDPKTVNILQGMIEKKYWTNFGQWISENFLDGSMQTDFPTNSTGYYISYLGLQLPVAPGDQLLLSSNITSIDGGNATYYDGFDYSESPNSTILPGHYWQNGLYEVSDNHTVTASGIFQAASNITSVLPWIAFYNPKGKFIINNITLKVIKVSNRSSYLHPEISSQNNTILTGSLQVNEMNALFPFDAALVLNNSKALPGLGIINVSAYQVSIESPGLYIVPLYYVFDRYGYIWGNGNYTVMDPSSFLSGNITLARGSYTIFMKISGAGFGNIGIGEEDYTYNTLASRDYFLKLNITAASSLAFSIEDIIGQISVNDLMIVGPNVSSYQISILTGSFKNLNYTLTDPDYASSMGMEINTAVSSIVVMKESYSGSWSITYLISGKVDQESPFLVNGWEMGFLIPSGASNITFRFSPPLFQESQIYITSISLPVLMMATLLTVIFDNKKRSLWNYVHK